MKNILKFVLFLIILTEAVHTIHLYIIIDKMQKIEHVQNNIIQESDSIHVNLYQRVNETAYKLKMYEQGIIIH